MFYLNAILFIWTKSITADQQINTCQRLTPTHTVMVMKLTSLRLYMMTEDWKRRAFVIPIPQKVRYLSNIFSSLAVKGPSSSFLLITWATPTICNIVWLSYCGVASKIEYC